MHTYFWNQRKGEKKCAKYASKYGIQARKVFLSKKGRKLFEKQNGVDRLWLDSLYNLFTINRNLSHLNY